MNANRSMILWITILSLFSCDPESKKTTGQTNGDQGKTAEETRVKHPGIEYEDGPLPDPETVIAYAGDFKVTVADYAFASKLGLLYAPEGVTEVPPDKMALPHIHTTMTQSLLMHKVIEDEAKKKNIEITDVEIDEYIGKNPELKRFVDAPEKLKPFGIKVDDIKTMARTEITKQKFGEALLEKTTKEEVWNAYKMKMDRVTAMVASTRNLPSSSEISAFTEANREKIKKYFDDNAKKYRVPSRVKLNVVRPPSGVDATVEQLTNAANRLRKGDRPKDIAADMKWEYRLDEMMQRKENKTAFDAESGTTGYDQKGPRGSYAWFVSGKLPSQPGVFTTPIEREIAAQLLQETEITKNVKDRSKKAKAVLKATTKKNAKKKGKELVGLGFKNRFVTFDRSGFIDGFGLAEPVVEDAMKRDKVGIGGPIRSRQEVFVYRSFERQIPDEKQFEKDYDAFREAVLKAKRPGILQGFMANYTKKHTSKLDTQPLRILYGVVKKKNVNAPKNDGEKPKSNDATNRAKYLIATRAPVSLLAAKNPVKRPKVDFEGTIENYIRNVVEAGNSDPKSNEKAKMSFDIRPCKKGGKTCVAIRGTTCRPNDKRCEQMTFEAVINIDDYKNPTLDDATIDNETVKDQWGVEQALRRSKKK